MEKEIVNRHLLDVTKTSNLISWSRNGSIAYIPPTPTSNTNLLLTYIENVNGVTWQLAKPLSISIKIDNNNNFLPQLSLVSWSTLSTDLAICDIYGNFYILLAGVRLLESKDIISPSFELTSYNHMEMIYRDIINSDINSPVNSGASVIAYKWLNIEKPQIWNKPATRVNLDYSNSDGNSFVYAYGVNQNQPHGLCHPIATKQALLVLRKNGQLMLYYQGEHKVEYHKICQNLSDDFQIINKAGIGFTNDRRAIITTWDSVTNSISTYSVEINWGFLIESAKRQKVDAHYHTPKESQKPPSLTVKKIHQMQPQEFYHEGEEEQQLNITELSSIDIISANPDPISKLCILITYDSSIIYRYSLDNNTVSDVFINLGIEKNIQAQSRELRTITLMDRIVRSGEIESITSGFLDYTFSILYKNGKIEVIDTRTFKVQNIITDDTKPNNISSIFDIGFQIPKVEHKNPLIMAVSPNMTAIVYTELFADSPNLKLKPFERIRNLSIEQSELYTTAVGLAYCHALALYSSTGSDDLIILIQLEAQRYRSLFQSNDIKDVESEVKKFVGTIISECHKAINFQIDGYSKDGIERLLSNNNTSLQKLLSLQLILAEVQQNHKAADISMIILNLRSISLGIMFSLSNIYRQISKKKPSEDSLQDSINRGECIISLLGSFKWLIDLLAYLNQELLQLTYIKNNNLKNSKLTLKNSLAIPIIMGKVPRLFLMYAITSMGRTHEILKKLHKDLTDSNKLFTPMKESLNRYFSICNTAPVTVNLFENFLRECDALCTKELSTKFKNKEQALKFEQKLVCQGELLDEFTDVALILLDRFTLTSSREMKIADLILYPTEWLDIGIMRNRLKIDPEKIINEIPGKINPRWSFDNGHIDALRKIFIDDGGNDNLLGLRQCTRCRAVSGVTDSTVFETPIHIGLWTMLFQRNCICGNPWITNL